MAQKSVKKSPKKNKSLKKNVKKSKKIRLKYKNILLFLAILSVLVLIILWIFRIPIKNIYISGNRILKDQEIIDFANLSDYPYSLSNLSKKIEERLLENIYIKEVKVYKKHLTEVHIEIVENKPIFFDNIKNKTVLSNKKVVDTVYDVPSLSNYVPNTIYDRFVEELNNVTNDVLIRISEIVYDPNDVDDSRFLLTMKDGNYVYLTLSKFKNVNNYIEIVRKFNNKKGILYLDSGEYFKIME